MSTSLVKASPSALGMPEEIHAKIAAFKEIAALAQAGFFPDGIKTAQQAMAVCWMGDAVGAHPMIALQNVIPIHQRLYFQWRFKWGLILSRYPEAEYEHVEDSEQQHVVRGRIDPRKQWTTVTFTREQCRKNPVTSKNPLYESDWPDMGFKGAMQRLCDRIAPHVLMGLPSDLPEYRADDAPASLPADPAAVLERAGASHAEVVPEAARDWPKDLFVFIRGLYWNGKKGKPEQEKRAIETAVNAARGSKDFTLPGVLAPSVAREALEFLQKKYPDGKLGPGSAENGGTAASGTPSPSGAGVDAPATAGPEPKNFDEQHADASLEKLDEELGEEVPLEDAPAPAPVDPVLAAQEAAFNAQFEADGTVVVLFDLVKKGKKAFPGRPFVKEAPPGSGAWYFVDKDISQQRGYTSGKLLSKDGEQKVSADECRILVELLRKAGVEGPVGR